MTGDSIVGTYRNAGVFIGDGLTMKYETPHFSKLPMLMHEYVEMLQIDMQENLKNLSFSEKHLWQTIFLNLAKHHIEFERIHHFVDGNGRAGRLLLNY